MHTGACDVPHILLILVNQSQAPCLSNLTQVILQMYVKISKY